MEPRNKDGAFRFRDGIVRGTDMDKPRKIKGTAREED